MLKALAPFIAILTGLMLPELASLSGLIRYGLMFMLMVSLSELELRLKDFSIVHLRLILLNFLIPFGLWFILKDLNPELALTAFVTGLAPTAMAVPVMLSMLRLKISFGVFAVFLSNFSIALLIPWLLPLLAKDAAVPHSLNIAIPIMTLLLIPLCFAQILKRTKLKPLLIRSKPLAWYVWIFMITIASARAAEFITGQQLGFADLLPVFWVALSIAVLSFGLGYLWGGAFKAEASQCLGQKNTLLMIWLSLNFLSPYQALGPIIYLMIHNTWSGFLLIKKKT
jgi:BASS family bile acid:Na+ symporter